VPAITLTADNARVADRALGAHVVHVESGAAQAIAQVPRAGLIGLAGRIDRRKLHQLPGQLDQRLPLVVDTREQIVQQHPRLSPAMLEQAGAVSIWLDPV
jgi:hypothetical protein